MRAVLNSELIDHNIFGCYVRNKFTHTSSATEPHDTYSAKSSSTHRFNTINTGSTVRNNNDWIQYTFTSTKDASLSIPRPDT